MKFSFGDKVIVFSKGFYEGATGTVVGYIRHLDTIRYNVVFDVPGAPAQDFVEHALRPRKVGAK